MPCILSFFYSVSDGEKQGCETTRKANMCPEQFTMKKHALQLLAHYYNGILGGGHYDIQGQETKQCDTSGYYSPNFYEKWHRPNPTVKTHDQQQLPVVGCMIQQTNTRPPMSGKWNKTYVAWAGQDRAGRKRRLSNAEAWTALWQWPNVWTRRVLRHGWWQT